MWHVSVALFLAVKLQCSHLNVPVFAWLFSVCPFKVVVWGGLISHSSHGLAFKLSCTVLICTHKIQPSFAVKWQNLQKRSFTGLCVESWCWFNSVFSNVVKLHSLHCKALTLPWTLLICPFILSCTVCMESWCWFNSVFWGVVKLQSLHCKALTLSWTL